MTGARRTAGWWKKIPAGYPVRFVALAMLALVVVAYCRSDDLRDWMVDDTRFAAEIREKRPPEPYKGKGIKYVDEVIIRKEGKAGKGK